jgi:hypothetical protein
MAWTDHKWAFILLILLASICLTEKPREMYENATGSSNRRRKFDNQRMSLGRVQHPLLGMGSE